MNGEQVLLGRVRGAAFEAPGTTTAEEVMEPGPATIRTDEPLARFVPRLRDRGVARIIVTTPEGQLVGVVEHETAERALAAWESKEEQRD